MLKILTIVGARPQFIKAAVFSRKIRSKKYSDLIEEILVHTGQHYDHNMSEIFFQEMEIPQPTINLGVGSGRHGEVTARMLEGIEKLIVEHSPNLVLVYGDTNSTLAGALAASKLHVPIAHVEAGLRSFIMSMPEEQNRRLTDHLSTWLFCPTETAVKNLEREGITNSHSVKPSADQKKVVQCGDIMYEAILYYQAKALEKQTLIKLIDKDLLSNYYVLTLHREENTDNHERLTSIINALNSYKKLKCIFPMHPRTKKIVNSLNLHFEPHIIIMEPVGYFDMIVLESKSMFIVTDSGGVQKEAYFLKKPCITLRDSTEWTELVETGWNTLVGADQEKILNALSSMPKYGKDIQLYGDGNTAEKIAEVLLRSY